MHSGNFIWRIKLEKVYLCTDSIPTCLTRDGIGGLAGLLVSLYGRSYNYHHGLSMPTEIRWIALRNEIYKNKIIIIKCTEWIICCAEKKERRCRRWMGEEVNMKSCKRTACWQCGAWDQHRARCEIEIFGSILSLTPLYTLGWIAVDVVDGCCFDGVLYGLLVTIK